MSASKKLSELSPPEKLVRIRQEDIIFTDKMRAELAALKDVVPDLTDPENPEFADWSKAVRGKFYRPRKQQVTIRLDMPVLDWFKKTGDQYQTLINQVLWEYVRTHRRPLPKLPAKRAKKGK